VSGVDVSSLAAKVPSWAWPLILISVTGLFQFLRNFMDKRHKAELAETAPSVQLRNPSHRGHRFRRIAGSIPTIAGSPVKG
jgi:hypothetical protein